jgi:hypothetical protein
VVALIGREYKQGVGRVDAIAVQTREELPEGLVIVRELLDVRLFAGAKAYAQGSSSSARLGKRELGGPPHCP